MQPVQQPTHPHHPPDISQTTPLPDPQKTPYRYINPFRSHQISINIRTHRCRGKIHRHLQNTGKRLQRRLKMGRTCTAVHTANQKPEITNRHESYDTFPIGYKLSSGQRKKSDRPRSADPGTAQVEPLCTCTTTVSGPITFPESSNEIPSPKKIL